MGVVLGVRGAKRLADDPVALRKCAGGTFLAAALAALSARGELIKTQPAIYPPPAHVMGGYPFPEKVS